MKIQRKWFHEVLISIWKVGGDEDKSNPWFVSSDAKLSQLSLANIQLEVIESDI